MFYVPESQSKSTVIASIGFLHACVRVRACVHVYACVCAYTCVCTRVRRRVGMREGGGDCVASASAIPPLKHPNQLS